MDESNSIPEETDVVTRMRTANRRQDYGGRRPNQYSHWIKEQMSWKETCYIGRWSFLGNLRVEGPEAVDVLADLSINSMEDFEIGQGKHVVQCNDDGKVIAEGVLLRTDDEEYVVHGVPAYWTGYNLENGTYDATGEYRDTFNFQIQGPNSLKVLDEVAEHSLRDVGFMRFDSIDIGGNEVRAVRFGMSGELGFELQGPAEYGEDVWEALYEGGQEFGVRRLSAKTSSINQLEAGIASRVRDYVSAIFGDDLAEYREYLRETATRDLITHPVEGSFDGDDISDWYRSPVELGWGRYVGDHEFTGRDAIESELDDPDRTLVTLEWHDEDVMDVYGSLFESGETFKYMDMPHQQKRAMIADTVVRDGEPVGVATMRGYSYYFRQMLSLCTIDVEHSEPGTEVTVLWGEGGEPASPTVEPHAQKEIRATVARTPYKEDRRREDIEHE
ncbi:glycine cleavage T C-terminal barrel domain-containing protein [Halorubrum sp. DTA98]|uniref:glycine cleavage T C-terminal barrel domain-containing protein n=1 Tax=Halorubrum sp. DTA98 TaxID=3402163 RepID=UPI003AAE683F